MTVHTHQLENGLRIVTEEMPGLKSASVGVWVTAGGRQEKHEQNGIAHFLEHMAFKGTKNRTALEIAETIENVGGFINAYTSREMTAYFARVLEADVTLALDVIADILLNPLFDNNDIETERGVILQEIGQSHDTPDDVIFDWLQEVSYPGQALGRTILGPPELVGGFGREDLVRFVSEYYSPGQMILAAAGAVDHEAIAAQAENLFGGVPSRPVPGTEKARFEGGERRVEKALEQAHFAVAFEAPGCLHDDVYTAQIHSIALGGGMSSRLFQEVRERRGLCYSVFAQAGAFQDTGMLTVYAGTGDEQIGELAELTIDEIRRSADDMTETEIDRARAQLKAGLLMGLESPSGRCERLARMTAIWGRVPSVDETIARIDSVNERMVRDYAGGLRSRGHPALALYGPVGHAPDRDELFRRLAA
ncbi:MAG: M16 family metallopeptidase [Paracoccaceae bacterium]